LFFYNFIPHIVVGNILVEKFFTQVVNAVLKGGALVNNKRFNLIKLIEDQDIYILCILIQYKSIVLKINN
jgi:hypothetical protein